MYNWSVYKITCKVNGKSYIGITQKSLKTRLGEHFRDAFPGRINANGTLYALHSAIQKYGKSNFSIEPLMEGLNLEMARQNEVKFIRKYNAYGGFKNKRGMPRGYNQSFGGEMPDFIDHGQRRPKVKKAGQKNYKKQVKNKLEEQSVQIDRKEVAVYMSFGLLVFAGFICLIGYFTNASIAIGVLSYLLILLLAGVIFGSFKR